MEKEVIYIAEREDLITYMINQSVVLQEEMITCLSPLLVMWIE